MPGRTRARDLDSLVPMRTLVIIPAFNEHDSAPRHARRAPGAPPDPRRRGRVRRVGGPHRRRWPATPGPPCSSCRSTSASAAPCTPGSCTPCAHDYDAAVQFDADGQHDPGHIKTLTHALDGGADMVIGTRFGETSADYDVGGTAGAPCGPPGHRATAHRQASTPTPAPASAGFNRKRAAVLLPELPERVHGVGRVAHPCDARGLRRHRGRPSTCASGRPGAPSSRRLKLGYHYVRLLLVLSSGARHRRRPPAQDRAAVMTGRAHLVLVC